MKTPKKAVGVICDEDAGSLGWRPQMVINDMFMQSERIDEILPGLDNYSWY